MGPAIIMGTIVASWIVLTFRPTLAAACLLGSLVLALAVAVTAWQAIANGAFDVWKALGGLAVVSFIFTWGSVAVCYTATKFARAQTKKQNDA